MLISRNGKRAQAPSPSSLGRKAEATLAAQTRKYTVRTLKDGTEIRMWLEPPLPKGVEGLISLLPFPIKCVWSPEQRQWTIYAGRYGGPNNEYIYAMQNSPAWTLSPHASDYRRWKLVLGQVLDWWRSPDKCCGTRIG